ncbi:MAG: hypothetical protein [Arizlama microvirus]|nr:MAG: hypothetical protein [Arizlama microvirus]
MAKRRKNRHDVFPSVPYLKKPKRDDFSFIASDLSRRVFEPPPVAASHLEDFLENDYQTSVRSYLSEVEDRRTFHPGGRVNRPPTSPRRRLVKINIKPTMHSPVVQSFHAPSHVAVCVRRKTRDEVLHALKKTGRGSGRPKRFNQFSKVKC